MVITKGANAATAESIFDKMDEVLAMHNIEWTNCIGLSLDNCYTNMVRHNSISSRALQKNPSIFIHGCPCHIVHGNLGPLS